jgi:transposase InsO family protein
MNSAIEAFANGVGDFVPTVAWQVLQMVISQLGHLRDRCHFAPNGPVGSAFPPNQLSTHSDRGLSMTSHNVADLLARLGVARSLSRPNTPNDNPFSDSQFKTMKYQPEFPERFGDYDDARRFTRQPCLVHRFCRDFSG